MKVLINNKQYSFPNGATLMDIYNSINEKLKYPVLAAYVNNELQELNYKVNKDAKLRFLDLTSRDGNRIYSKGLVFLLYCAFKEIYPNNKFKVCHSIDKGIRINTDIVLNSESINAITSKMKEMVKLSLPISKCLVKKTNAEDYFKKLGNDTKVRSLKYLTNHYINLYKLNDVYDYLYSVMPLSTSCFISFSLHIIDDKNFVLEFPSINSDGKIPTYISREKVLKAFDENYKFSKKLDIFNSSDLNKSVATGRISDIIMLSEVVSNNNLLNIAKEIFDKKESIKIVLISGPTSSGKTTVSKKLSMYFNCFGLRPIHLSIDDYFVNRVDTPKLENGKYDYESLRAVDMKLFNTDIQSLLNGKEIDIPHFNFLTGCREYIGDKLKLGKNDILIVEGLHGLSEELTSFIKDDNKYKIYVSPFMDLNIDNLNMISTSDLRLLRRIVRDYRTRGTSAEDTIKRWKEVRDGEEKYVFKYQNSADQIFNSSLIYEIGVLKLYVEPLLYDIDSESIVYEEARRLLNFLSMFVVVPTDSIPNESILKEFIGNSYF